MLGLKLNHVSKGTTGIYFTMKINPSLYKLLLNFKGGINTPGLTFLVKSATGLENDFLKLEV